MLSLLCYSREHVYFVTMPHETDKLTNSSPEELEQVLRLPNLLRDLLLQLIKDFQTAQLPLDLDIDERYSFEELREYLAHKIDEHLKKGGTLKYLLNRVDLTEKQIHRAIPTAIHASLQLLAELIIKRELQKVVIRYWYRQSDEKED